MWIDEIEVNGTIKHQILYSYYEKEVSSKYLIHKHSAISYKSKINILINDLTRVMKNTSVRVNEAEKERHIQHFINKMQFSGYDKNTRIQVYRKAKNIFQENVRKNDNKHLFDEAMLNIKQIFVPIRRI